MRPRVTTRVLLVCGALAAVHVLLHLATVTLLTALAPFSPPLYGLAAGVHSLMPFLARRLTATPGTATLTAAVAGVFVATSNGSGIIALIPLLVAGVVIDLVVRRVDVGGEETPSRQARIAVRYLVAAVSAGTALFAISLSVFSPHHLTPLLIGGTLVARVAGEIAAALLSGVLARALRRAGIRGADPVRHATRPRS